MDIRLEKLGKRYQNEWIFRRLSVELKSGNSYVIKGFNGSGKSTLLQVIAGNKMQSEGEVHYTGENGENIKVENIFRHLSIAAPYQELIEEFTLTELLGFHQQLKPFVKGLSVKEVLKIIDLDKADDRQVSEFSSGMRQRVRLALAILSDVPMVFLDEPLSNLDQKGSAWYKELIETYKEDRLFLVCSNENIQEFFFCNKSVNIMDYKSK